MKFKLILLFFIIFVSKTKSMEELMLSSVLVEDQAEDESKNFNDNIIKKVKSFVVSQWYKSDLWKAVLANDFEACKKALQNGANPNSLIFDNRYWLYDIINGMHSIFARACYEENIDIRIIDLLIRYDADVNYCISELCDLHEYIRVTPLGLSLRNLRYDIAELLINNGACPNIHINTLGDLALKYDNVFQLYKNYKKQLYKKKIKSVFGSLLCNDLQNIIVDYIGCLD